MNILTNAVSVFLSYEQHDEQLLQKLEKYLKLLNRQGLVSIWSARQIVPGTNRTEVINEQFEQASIILLLISVDFLASDYCYEVEMTRALARHEAGQVRVIPIIARSVDWTISPFAHLQVLPTDGKPISTWDDQDAAFVDIVGGIRRAIEDLSLLPASRLHAGLPPIWNIPYPRNAFFTGRDAMLLQVHSQFQVAVLALQPQAISGLGGIGKTQIAVEYAYRYAQEYEAVLWVRAESKDILISSYNTVATLLKLPERDAEEQEITIGAVKAWLQGHSGWLLILDNADDLVLLGDFLPPVAGGHILLTTRAGATGQFARRTEVESFTDEQGAIFLLRRASLLAPDHPFSEATKQDQTLALSIAHELGGLPLALDQAGAYLEQTGFSLADYQQLYQSHPQQILGERHGLMGLVNAHPDPIATTWLLSFDRVEQKNIVATRMLRFCAYLAADAIPLEVMTEGTDPVAEDLLTLGQAIETLRAYSLVGHDPATRTLSMHRLVQTVIQDAMTLQEQEQWRERAIKTLDAVLPKVTHTVWPQYERFLPHVTIVANMSGKIERWELARELADVLIRTADYLAARARYEQAEPLYRQALRMIEEERGPDHLDMALPLNNLAELYRKQSKYRETEPLIQHALQIWEKELGPDHFEMAFSLNNLALLYFQQGKYGEAEPLFERALRIMEERSGSDSLDMTFPLSNLALLYFQQSKYGEAEPLYQRVMRLWEEQGMQDHPDLAFPLSNQGFLYLLQGKHAEAELLFKRALRIWEEQLGPDHPNVAYALNGLATLYTQQGKYGEAEPLLQRALQIWEGQLGPDHPDVATALSNLANLYSEQGKYEEAELLFKRALQIWEGQLGLDHPQMGMGLVGLASIYIYNWRDKYDEAEWLYRRALRIAEQMSPEHQDVATSLVGLANLYRDQGRYGEAKPLYERALRIREEQMGLDHLLVVGVLSDQALFYRKQKMYIEAESLYKRALQIGEERLGPDHPNVASSLNNLAKLYYWQDKDAKAELLYQRALQISEEQLGSDHLNVAASLAGLATIYYGRGRFAKAKPLYERVLQIREKQLSPNHLDVATALNDLADLYRNQINFADAELLYERALQIREAQLGPKHPDTQKIRKKYANINIYRSIIILCVFLAPLIGLSVCLALWFFHNFGVWGWIALVFTLITGRSLAVLVYARYKRPPISAS